MLGTSDFAEATTPMLPPFWHHCQHGPWQQLATKSWTPSARLTVRQPGVWARRMAKRLILLMEEILHHLGCVRPYRHLYIYYINWCRIPSINSIMWKELTFFDDGSPLGKKYAVLSVQLGGGPAANKQVWQRRLPCSTNSQSKLASTCALEFLHARWFQSPPILIAWKFSFLFQLLLRFDL